MEKQCEHKDLTVFTICGNCASETGRCEDCGGLFQRNLGEELKIFVYSTINKRI